MKLKRLNRYINSFHIILLGFLAVILLGSILLMLPFSTLDGKGADFLDALFTATSATCVTGLIIHNTAEYWSLFGQLVIITLIQIGGMGIITVAIMISQFAGKKIGLMQRSTMQEAIAAPQVGGIVKMTGFLFKGVLLIEGLGAVLLSFRFCRDYGVKGIWYSVFHSISAFCNAGFDILGIHNGNSSLMQYVGDPIVNIVIMLLITIGGIGFFTWHDIVTYRFQIHKYRLQTKIVLTVYGILIILPALYFYFLEFSQDHWNNLTMVEKVFASVFQSVTLRTAGFNSVDLAAVSEPGQLLMIICMLIGGASGSTAGGFKVTTLAVLLLAALAVFSRREDAQCYGRRIAADSIQNAIAIFMMYVVLCLSSTLIIASIEQREVLEILFEVASALGTVGLTLGITGELCTVSHIILIVLMYLGRVGGLTLIFAIVTNKKPYFSHYPEERITVG